MKRAYLTFWVRIHQNTIEFVNLTVEHESVPGVYRPNLTLGGHTYISNDFPFTIFMAEAETFELAKKKLINYVLSGEINLLIPTREGPGGNFSPNFRFP